MDDDAVNSWTPALSARKPLFQVLADRCHAVECPDLRPPPLAQVGDVEQVIPVHVQTFRGAS